MLRQTIVARFVIKFRMSNRSTVIKSSAPFFFALLTLGTSPDLWAKPTFDLASEPSLGGVESPYTGQIKQFIADGRKAVILAAKDQRPIRLHCISLKGNPYYV